MSGSSEGRASVPVSVVQEGHKLSVTGAEWEEGGGYSLHVEVPIVYDVTVKTSPSVRCELYCRHKTPGSRDRASRTQNTVEQLY